MQQLGIKETNDVLLLLGAVGNLTGGVLQDGKVTRTEILMNIGKVWDIATKANTALQGLNQRSKQRGRWWRPFDRH